MSDDELVEIRARLGTVMLNQMILARMLVRVGEHMDISLYMKLLDDLDRLQTTVGRHYPKKESDDGKARTDQRT